jgi:acetyltransferase-like isoleucine patch superfamily enzyme
MAAELNPKAIYDFAQTEKSFAISLFMPYDLEISIKPHIVISVGRFSLGLLGRIHVIPAYDGVARLSIGAFCEAASGASILVGGEHANSSLLNYSYGLHAEYYREFMDTADLDLGLRPAKPISIGDNVILSREAMLVNAAEVGTGVVIGAGAVVAGPCRPLGVYGGVPARRIRDRFDERMAELYHQIDLANICAHSLPSLPRKLFEVQEGSLGIGEFRASVEYLKARPKLHVDGLLNGQSGVAIRGIRGFSVGGEMVSDPAIVEKLERYFAQPVSKPTSIKWSPDIFYALGLY